MIFLTSAGTMYSDDAIFYSGFTTGYLYALFSDDTLDADAIGEKLEISDELNVVTTERAEYSRIVKDGDTLLMVEGLHE